MFKSFQDTSALQQFHGFPNLNMQQATSAYGFSGVTFWLDAAYGLNTQTNLGAVSRWQARVGGSVFEQATAGAQPRLILNDANYNNLPSVDAQDIARVMFSNLGLKINPNISIAVISKVNTNIGNNGIIGSNSASGGASQGITDGGSLAGYNGFGYQRFDVVQLQGTTESTNARIKIITSTNVIVNGVNEATGTFNDVYEAQYLFQLAGLTSRKLVGSIAEIIAFGYSMTSDEAIALSNNINQKYALY